MTGAVITGWGAALPPQVVTNADLEARLDTTDAWIRERTGILERRIGGTTTGLAVDAGREAMHRAGVTGDDVDLVVVCTTTPDRAIPSVASAVQDQLGVAGGAMDLNAACAGFVYGLVTAFGLLSLGTLRRVLLIGSETLSRVVDWEDRNTAVLFADGAGAVVLEAVEGPGDLVGFDLGSDGATGHLLYAELGGHLKMEGREVFRRAVRVTVDSASLALGRAGLGPDEVDVVIPHQANLRIIDAACSRLGLPVERTVNTLDRTGNTSAASVPITLGTALDAGRIGTGDAVLLVGFGAGMSWASAVLRWSRATGGRAGARQEEAG
ncbi:MAG: beta-ketoacyl-ACP synthase III [Acidimicrobiales bacterium]